MANARTEADVTATGGDVFAALEPQPFWRRFQTGTTTLGKGVIDHSFQLPLQVAWVVTALVGLGVAALFEA